LGNKKKDKNDKNDKKDKNDLNKVKEMRKIMKRTFKMFCIKKPKKSVLSEEEATQRDATKRSEATHRDAIIKTVKDICTPTGDYGVDILRAHEYARAVGMDAANTKMMEVMTTEGPEAASKAMMEDCGNDYAAMRARYG
jgi:hypothetical protein